MLSHNGKLLRITILRRTGAAKTLRFKMVPVPPGPLFNGAARPTHAMA